MTFLLCFLLSHFAHQKKQRRRCISSKQQMANLWSKTQMPQNMVIKLLIEFFQAKEKNIFPFFKKRWRVSVKIKISTWDCQGNARHMKVISHSVISCLISLFISGSSKLLIKWLIRGERGKRKNAIVRKLQISVSFMIALISAETKRYIYAINCLFLDLISVQNIY